MDMVSGKKRREEVKYQIRSVVFTEEDVRKKLRVIKQGKQPVLDKLKGKLYVYRSMAGSGLLVERLAYAYNEVIASRVVPRGWEMSRTVMLLKKKKPVTREHRLIALTNAGYILFMGIMKNMVVEHLDRNVLTSDFQAGFTGGKRLEENLLIVRYCNEEMYRKGRKLVVVAIDIEKAVREG